MVRVGGITSGNGKLYHGGAMIHLQLHIRVFLSLVVENAQNVLHPIDFGSCSDLSTPVNQFRPNWVLLKLELETSFFPDFIIEGFKSKQLKLRACILG